MAKYGISNHPKVKRLAQDLSMPVPHVLGHLTLLWETGYQLGPAIGDARDVKNSAGWEGDAEVFAAALLSCGGAARSGFLDADTERPGCYLIHDLFENAPSWVSQKAGKGALGELDRTCDTCGGVFRSTEYHAKYCSNACTQKAWRLSRAHSVTDDTHVTQPVTDDTGATPKPTIRGEIGASEAPLSPPASRMTLRA